MNFKKWIKNIQTATYNGVCTVPLNKAYQILLLTQDGYCQSVQLSNHNTALIIKLYCDFLSLCTRPLQCGEQKFTRLLQLLTKNCITLIDLYFKYYLVIFLKL